MHEVRVTAPIKFVSHLAHLALQAGARDVTSFRVLSHGTGSELGVVSVSTSTPVARTFIDELFEWDEFNLDEFSLTSRELRAILGSQESAVVTRPMNEPAVDVFEDLWQLAHVTPSYVGRALGGGLLMANGMFENDAVEIVIAALILLFFSQILGLTFGVWAGEYKLTRTAMLALAVSFVSCVAGGAVVAVLRHSPLPYEGFRGPLVNISLSAIIGVVGGLTSADDAGRRYLIGVAAAVQCAVFIVWLGAVLVSGLPAWTVFYTRLGTLFLNIAAIGGGAVLGYRMAGMQRERVNAVLRPRQRGVS